MRDRHQRRAAPARDQLFQSRDADVAVGLLGHDLHDRTCALADLQGVGLVDS